MAHKADKDIVYAGRFNDKAVYDPKEKTALSVRDGVIEYLGAELNMLPADKLFTVYRSPATIANAAMRMRGLPITDGHVDLELPAPSNGGFVSEAEMVDATDSATDTTIAIRNKLAISDTLLAMVEAGRRELSLGYHGLLRLHDEYDFEQYDIDPHHLATVDQGRCGPMCSFIDKKPTKEPDNMKNKLHKAFNDAEGAMNLQQIVELATALPEAIKSVPVDQLQKLLPALQQIVEAAKAVMPDPAGGEEVVKLPSGEEAEAKAAADAAAAEEVAAADAAAAEEVAAADAAAEGEEKEKKFNDAIAAATDTAIKAHGVAIAKARDFLADDYNFADKNTVQIMRDAIATDTKEQFADSELPLAFKMLRKPDANYKKFGDAQPTTLTNLKDKEL